MASPSAYQNIGIEEPGVYKLFVTANLDGYGGVSSITHRRGIASVAEDGSTAGLLHVVLSEPWVAVLGVDAVIVSSSVKSGTLNVALVDPVNKKVDLQYQESGSAHHLAGATQVLLELTLLNEAV